VFVSLVLVIPGIPGWPIGRRPRPTPPIETPWWLQSGRWVRVMSRVHPLVRSRTGNLPRKMKLFFLRGIAIVRSAGSRRKVIRLLQSVARRGLDSRP
jgi:hypothetical protein